MIRLVKFKVASYALLDALEGLENSRDKDSYLTIIVTKEDGDLLVIATYKYFNSHSDLAATDCAPDPTEEHINVNDAKEPPY